MKAAIKAIEYYLPVEVLSNDDLSAEYPDWSVEKIEQKTGITERHIAAEDECASDLGVAAAERLFQSGACRPQDIDYVVFCTQSPDYFLPTTACLIQERLRIPASAGALDVNLGCSGFVYGLGLVKGLIETRQAGSVLLITAETYSKFIHPNNRGARTIFGDAAAVTLVQTAPEDTTEDWIGPFVYGTDGSGGRNLIVTTGAQRKGGKSPDPESGGPEYLYMDGPEIFDFTIRVVPNCVNALLEKVGKTSEDIDLFVFHQANRFILDHLRRKMRIPSERFYMHMNRCGNTVSSTIPIALKEAVSEGKLKSGSTAMLVGFGVGYSWGATMIRWP